MIDQRNLPPIGLAIEANSKAYYDSNNKRAIVNTILAHISWIEEALGELNNRINTLEKQMDSPPPEFEADSFEPTQKRRPGRPPKTP